MVKSLHLIHALRCELEELTELHKQIHNTVCDYPSRRKYSGTLRRARKRRLEESHPQSSSSTSNSTHGIVHARSLSNIRGNNSEIRTPPNDRAKGIDREWRLGGYSSCGTDGHSNGSRAAGIDGILQGFGDSPNVNAKNQGGGNCARVSGKRTEGEEPELIDRILECEGPREIYEDHGTLSVSFHSR
jgi:hypothetical protein